MNRILVFNSDYLLPKFSKFLKFYFWDPKEKMDEPYSPESIEILDQLEEASVKSELPETGDEPKDKSVNLNYGELTVAAHFSK